MLGEAEASFVTLVSGGTLSSRYALPITLNLSTDSAAETVKTPYATVLYEMRVRVDPATNAPVGFSLVADSSVCSVP